MSEETKDIEETKVAEEKKMETEQTILSQPTEKKAAETVTQIQQSVEIQEQKEKLSQNRREVLSDQGKKRQRPEKNRFFPGLKMRT